MSEKPDTTTTSGDPSECERQVVGHAFGSMDKSVLIGEPRPHDWSEDFEHENGCYQNNCCHCNTIFLGHKSRVSCKVCVEKSQKSWDALTEEEKKESIELTAAKIERLLS